MFSNWFKTSLFSTHAATQERVARLPAMAR